MNRTILFRGKRTDNGKFIEGDLIKLDNHTLIATKDMWASNLLDNYSTTKTLELEVLPVVAKSVGQFTGLTDKNGTKIFEGDIVRILYTDWVSKNESDQRTLEQYLIDKSNIASVEFNDNAWEVKSYSKKYDDYNYSSISTGTHGRIEVIGNVHDNPELLK